MPEFFLSHMSCISALGDDPEEILHNLSSANNAYMQADSRWNGLITGAVRRELPEHHFACCSLLAFCYNKIRHDVEKIITADPSRVAIVIGSSNGGIDEHYKNLLKGKIDPEALEVALPSTFLAKYTGAKGPAYTISTACSSSGKAFAAARRLIEADVADAVLVGGADSLSAYTIAGFTALEATSSGHSNPFSKNRDGINLGEGAALFLMSKNDLSGEGIRLMGVGESSDAWHATAPHPEGRGAIFAITEALGQANIAPSDRGYINLHGTGTALNDSMESFAVNAVFDNATPVSSTKALTGHTLGACGAIEAAFCWLTLSPYNKANLLPAHAWDGIRDDKLPMLNFVEKGSSAEIKYCLSNAFAFGGNNVSLVLGR
jgi:3-oxoacyl-[acyl-carrier-protein] synthase-1